MRKLVGLIFLLLLAVAILNPYTMAWLAGRLVVSDGLEPSDAVATLRGSSDQERTRLEEAARVVERRYAPVLLASVDSEPYYNQPIRDLVEEYLRKREFPREKLHFCENRADTTREEAQALLSCLLERRAKDVIVVTSEYHTRRARAIFRGVFAGSGIAVRIHPVYDSEYWDAHWWRRRRWAKTFLIETLALSWSVVEGFQSPSQPDAASPPEPTAAQTP